MSTQITAILFGSTIKPTPLQKALHRPALALPITDDQTLLDQWLNTLSGLATLHEVRVILNNEADAQAVAVASRTIATRTTPVSVRPAPAAWRGLGGTLHDVVGDLNSDQLVLAIEANRCPTADLGAIVAPLTDEVDGVVGMRSDQSPTGIYLLRQPVIEQVASVGFIDLKEQLIPALYDSGHRLRAAEIDIVHPRIDSRSAYLACVGDSEPRSVADCRTDGACVIGPGAEIGEGVVVHNSVIFDGAIIGNGAVIVRSVLGPGADITSGATVVDQIIAPLRPRSAARPRSAPPRMRATTRKAR